MKKKVLHFIRKQSQLRASFILNQITNHFDYEPYIGYYQKTGKGNFDGGFAETKNDDIKIIWFGENESIFEHLLFKVFKLISNRKGKQQKEIVKSVNPDVLHFHYGTDAGIYLKTLRTINIPKLISFYGYECSGFPHRFLGLGKKYLQTRVYRYADKVFAMSPDMKLDLIKTGCPEEKVIVHYYGTDVAKFNKVHDYNEHTLVRFLIISGLVPQKGHMFLLQAFKIAFSRNENISLTIIGDGPLKSIIYGFIVQNGLEEIVTMPGPVVYGSEEQLKALDGHDVFIHPSVTDVNGDKEGIPGSIVEAMAAGLPVISTYHAGIPYIIENNETGLLVPENDIQALTEAILKIAASADLRQNLGKAGQKFAIANLDLQKKEKELESIYNQLIN